MSVLDAAEGDYRELLVALRDLIARRIDDGCSPRDLVGLSRRLLDLAAELRAVDADSSEHAPLRVVSDEPFDPAAV
ncbi:hypothetical protein [Modestobacter sp. SYSU DS0875]